MKSSFVIAVIDGEPLFFEDLRTFVAKDSAALREAALAGIQTFLSTPSAEKRKALASTVAEAVDVSETAATRALRCLSFLSRAVGSASSEESEQGFLDALQRTAKDAEQPPLTDEEAHEMVAFLHSLGERRGEIRKSLSELRAKQGVLPIFESLHWTVEMRGVRILADDDSPGELVGMVPIASVRLKCDVGNPNDFFFQLSEDGIEELTDRLGDLREELRALKKYASVH